MNPQIKYSLIFGALGALFFMPFLGGVHLFDWDEINFAEISREMLILKDYLRVYIDFEPFWEKPPFFFWLQAFSMKLFGVGEYAARFPNAVCGVITLVLLFNIGNRLYDYRFGAIWALVYLGSILPHLYFKSGIIDPWFNLFIFVGLYYFVLFHWENDQFDLNTLERNKWLYLILGGLAVGMGILTKGPVAYLIVGLCLFVYWIYQRFRLYISPLQFLVFTLSAFLIMFIWIGLETVAHGPWFVLEFTKYQYRLFNTPDAGHGGFFGYHFVVLLLGCFPASLFTLRAFFKQPTHTAYQADFKVWMLILFWVVLILFSVVQSKIVHYSSMAYFPLTYLAALTVYQILQGEISFPRWLKIGLWTLGGIVGLLVTAVPFVGMNIEVLVPLFANDPFAVANLGAEVTWTGFEAIAGLWLLAITFWGVKWMGGSRPWRGVITLFGGTAIFVMLTLVLFIQNIERYSQEAAIDFFESKAGEDAYVEVYGYKSYAQLFYARRPLDRNPDWKQQETPSLSQLIEGFENYTHPAPYSRKVEKNWLYTGEIDKDVYLVTKVHKAEEVEQIGTFERIGEKNGFVFFVRKAVEPVP